MKPSRWIILVPLLAFAGWAFYYPQPAIDDRTEALLWHLEHRASAAEQSLGKLRNTILRNDNAQMQEAIRHGWTPKSMLDPPRPGDELEPATRMALGLMDAQEIIDWHNTRHPRSPQAGVKDILQMTCGDCADIRALRESQFQQEAVKRGK